MPINRLNHAVLYVRNVAESVAFYCDVLGFTPVAEYAGISGAAFLRAAGSSNDHDLGLFEVGADAGPSQAGRGTVGLYHLAWEVDTLSDLESFAVALARPVRSSGRQITARRSPCTATTRAAWSSRSPGLCRPRYWTPTPALGPESGRST